MQIWRRRVYVTAYLLMISLAVSIASAAENKARWKGAAPNSEDCFRFMVMGDRTGVPIPGEWEEAIREINRLKPDFVMSVGDFIGPGAWDAFDAEIRKLSAPFYYCPGNHDIADPATKDLWLARYGVDGKSYYSFDSHGCHFVVLDTPLYRPDTMDIIKEELTWLANDLASATNAKHVFLFYHVPLTDPPIPIPAYKGFWETMVKLLPAGKTTIFNGHLHGLSYSAPDGIPVYVLGPTGAYGCDAEGTFEDKLNRELGMFRMVMQVTVDNGAPMIAVIPLHEVLPGDYVLRSFSGAFISMIQSMIRSQSRAPLMSPRGGTLALAYSNSLSAPLRVAVVWDAPQWDARPPAAETNLTPGKNGVLTFALKPSGPYTDFPDFPHYAITYETTNPAGKKVSYHSVNVLPVRAELDIPKVKDIIIDGKPGDWRNVKKYELKSKDRLVGGGPDAAWKYWDGEQDLSAVFYLGHDSQRLYVCLDVTDDQMAIDGKDCFDNDGVELYWDSRPADQQDGKHGIGTGQVVLAVPPEGQPPVPSWFMRNGATMPKNLVAAVTRKPGGYTYEFSVPLNELGVKTPVTADQTMNLELMVHDRDLVNGEPTRSHIDTSARAGAYGTSFYAHCTFR